ncbi:MAG: hypothetical protein U9N83_03395 [Thermodesulfobacteriota bacterium]|nr:hypothetical protein [Thermodesulfobacteriota bacterium]
MRRTFRTLNDYEMQRNAEVGLFTKPSSLPPYFSMSSPGTGFIYRSAFTDDFSFLSVSYPAHQLYKRAFDLLQALLFFMFCVFHTHQTH